MDCRVCEGRGWRLVVDERRTVRYGSDRGYLERLPDHHVVASRIAECPACEGTGTARPKIPA